MNQRETKFVATVWKYYRKYGRHRLPWRLTHDPYRILVSEVMLQQTQVDRVIPKYKSFLKKFPTIASLAQASLGTVLKEWQGLGYNRRAKYLHASARWIVDYHKGRTPTEYDQLKKLPGVGPYTAGAIMNFAYARATPMIETNIRTAYLQHFFKTKSEVPDREILRYIGVTLDTACPREWYFALMDYGAYIKKKYGSLNSKSAHFIKQSTFSGSDRQIRGAIIKALIKGARTQMQLASQLPFSKTRIALQLKSLEQEKMIHKKKRAAIAYALPR